MDHLKEMLIWSLLGWVPSRKIANLNQQFHQLLDEVEWVVAHCQMICLEIWPFLGAQSDDEAEKKKAESARKSDKMELDKSSVISGPDKFGFQPNISYDMGNIKLNFDNKRSNSSKENKEQRPVIETSFEDID